MSMVGSVPRRKGSARVSRPPVMPPSPAWAACGVRGVALTESAPLYDVVVGSPVSPSTSTTYVPGWRSAAVTDAGDAVQQVVARTSFELSRMEMSAVVPDTPGSNVAVAVTLILLAAVKPVGAWSTKVSRSQPVWHEGAGGPAGSGLPARLPPVHVAVCGNPEPATPTSLLAGVAAWTLSPAVSDDRPTRAAASRSAV